MIALPARPIVRSYVARSTKVWILARVLLGLQLAFAAQDRAFGIERVADHLFGLGHMVIVVAVSTALGVVETHRRHEWALLGNLGIGFRELLPLLVLPPVVGEMILHVTYAVVRLAA